MPRAGPRKVQQYGLEVGERRLSFYGQFHNLVAGGRGRGRPVRAAGASPVTGALGAEHEWGCPRSSAVRTRLEVMNPL